MEPKLFNLQSSRANKPQAREFEQVAAEIRRQISEGVLKVGDRLPTERHMALSLGVSRNTIREALRSLEYAGLVDQRPGSGGGAYITNGGIDVIRTAFDDLMRFGSIASADLTEARIVIGREVVFLACARHTNEDFKAFVKNVEQTRLATEAGNTASRLRHSLEFHRLLGVAARNPVLGIITNVLTDMTSEFVRVVSKQQAHSGARVSNQYVLDSRERMLHLLEQRDCAAAATEYESYLRATLQHYLGDTAIPAPSRYGNTPT